MAVFSKRDIYKPSKSKPKQNNKVKRVFVDLNDLSEGGNYPEGVQRGVFILDANTKTPFLGKMRVGRTVYPDFFHPNATKYWSDMLDLLYKKVPFSGLWLDSNEFTSFCTGRC